MTYTYADLKIGDLVDGERVIAKEDWSVGPVFGPAEEYVRITVASGGRRTEKASHPAGPTDWRLAAVSDEDLAVGADHFADQWRWRGTACQQSLAALHGVALEINRRAS